MINWYYTTQFTNESNLTVNLSKTYLSKIPIRVIGLKDQENMIKRVDEILYAKANKKEADILKLESEIDLMVYQLYGLTDEEIAIVEA